MIGARKPVYLIAPSLRPKDTPHVTLSRLASLAPAAERVRTWLHEAMFPFWAERGPHPRGGFRERLALDGAPVDDDMSRVRVQARQTYVFARAALMGWEPERARALARRGAASVLGPCRRPDGLVGRLVNPGVGLVDAEPELYDNAFALLALAWAARALEDRSLLDEAGVMLAALARTHGHPAGGFEESVPARLPRRQNPHMHLFEASLALADASGDAAHAERAAMLQGLLETRFFDRKIGQLLEFFSADWVPLTDDAGDVIEPGHGLEWAALLDLDARRRGAKPAPIARALYESALPHLDARGFAPMSVRLDGAPRDATRRTWSQTEALRAHVAFARRGDAEAEARALALVDALFEDHLAPAPAGAWIDHYDAAGTPCVTDITAATGYHLLTAFAELIEAAP